MRKSQWKPAPEDPQEKNEQRQTSYEEQERPERTVGDLRKIFESQETDRPQRKNDGHEKGFEVHEQNGTIYKPHVLHSGVDQNRNVPNQGNKIEKISVNSEDPQEKNEEHERPAMTVGDLRKIFDLQETNKDPQEKNDMKKEVANNSNAFPCVHNQERPAMTVGNPGKIHEPQKTNRPQTKSEVQDQNGTGYKSNMLHLGVDQNRIVPNQVFWGNKIEPQETNEKTPVKSDKSEQDIEKLQIKIDDLQKKMECSLDKTEAISATMGYLLKKIDKGENDKYGLHKQIGDLLKNLENTPKKDDDLQKKFEEISATIGDILKKLDKGEQDRDVLWEKIEKMKQEKDEIAQEKNEIAQEKEVLKHNLEKMKQEKDEIAQEKEQLKKEIETKREQFKSSWRDIPLYADWRKEEFQTVNLTLDAATAHPSLFLSEEGRRVTWQEPCQELPSSPERFVSIPCVLGQLHVNSGRYFWEVEVQNVHSWDLGVCRNNVERNGRVTMSPQNGFWAIRLYNGGYWGLTSPETSLTLKEKPLYVGVFLDYEAGDVSFYNMKDGSHIYTFSKQTFYGVLRPLFRLWSSDSGPLTIVQVE